MSQIQLYWMKKITLIKEYSINFINDSELKFVIRYNIAWFVIELLNLK